MKRIACLSVLTLGTALSIFSSAVSAEPPMQPFYAAVMKMAPEGKLGQVIKREKLILPSKERKLGEWLTFRLIYQVEKRLQQD